MTLYRLWLLNAGFNGLQRTGTSLIDCYSLQLSSFSHDFTAIACNHHRRLAIESVDFEMAAYELTARFGNNREQAAHSAVDIANLVRLLCEEDHNW